MYVKKLKIKELKFIIKDTYYLEELVFSIDIIKLELPLQLIIIEPLNLDKLMHHKVENFSPLHIGVYESLKNIENHVTKLKKGTTKTGWNEKIRFHDKDKPRKSNLPQQLELLLNHKKISPTRGIIKWWWWWTSIGFLVEEN